MLLETHCFVLLLFLSENEQLFAILRYKVTKIFRNTDVFNNNFYAAAWILHGRQRKVAAADVRTLLCVQHAVVLCWAISLLVILLVLLARKYHHAAEITAVWYSLDSSSCPKNRFAADGRMNFQNQPIVNFLLYQRVMPLPSSRIYRKRHERQRMTVQIAAFRPMKRYFLRCHSQPFMP